MRFSSCYKNADDDPGTVTVCASKGLSCLFCYIAKGDRKDVGRKERYSVSHITYRGREQIVRPFKMENCRPLDNNENYQIIIETYL
jgi:hypothetical protein